MEKELLVKFNGSQKVVALKESDDILKIIQEKFGIQQTHIILQNYDKEWDDWLDVSSFEEIPNRTVLRCVVPKLLSSETVIEVNKPKLPELSESFNTDNDTDDTEILELQSDSSTSSEEIIVGITSANLKAKWPDKFPIEEKKFSLSLKEALKSKICLLWDQKRELLEVISLEIQKYTDSPSKIQRKQVALQLISKYPYLREALGSGTDGSEERIRDKMKNVRRIKRTKESPSGSATRKRGPPPTVFATVNKKAKRGEVNWSPVIPDGEDETSLKVHLDLMNKEWKKTNPNMDVIKQRMEVTYAQRRQFINGNPLLFDVKETYPALFSVSEIGNEFKRLTDTELHETFKDSLSKIASKILAQIRGKANILPSTLKYLQIEDRTVAAVLVLPTSFNNESFIKVFEREATREYVVEAADLNPFVAVIGDPESPKFCHIVAEKTILFDTPHVISAASSLFGVLYACNMEYPKTMCESFIFIQKFCMKLSDKLKTPRKVLSYVEKIRM